MDQRERALALFANWRPGNPAGAGNQPRGPMGFVLPETYVARFLREHPECAELRPDLTGDARQRARYGGHIHVDCDKWDEGATNREKCLRSLPDAHD